MSAIIDRIDKYIKLNRMFENCEHIIVGLSGGADSVFLLRVLCMLKGDCAIHAVHINHQIREEAMRDATFSKKLCESLGVDFKCISIDVTKLAKDKGYSLEEAGRVARYEAFLQEMKRYSKAKIAVAHHMNDQAETVLMNIFRGSGLRGLAGISAVRDEIVRPLLVCTRKEIEDQLSLWEQSYMTDDTNTDINYTRNAIRNVLLPNACEYVNSEAISHLANVADSAREAFEFIERQTNRAWSECVLEKFNCELIENAEKEYTIRVDELEKQDIVIQKNLIHSCIVKLAGKAKDVYSKHVEAVLSLVSLQVGRAVDICYGIKASREYDAIRLYVNRKEESDEYFDNHELITISKDQIVADMRCDVELEQSIYCEKDGFFDIKGVRFEILDAQSLLEQGVLDKDYFLTDNNQYTKYFDYDTIADRLFIRQRQEQDIICINRDNKYKSLGKEFKDRKIPARLRDDVLVIADDNEVLWAVGVRKSECKLVTKDSDRVLRVSIIY